MFKRLIYEDWTTIVPIISFVATATVSIVITIQALCLPKKRCERLAAIPLSEQSKKP